MRPLAGGRCGRRVMMGYVGLKAIKNKQKCNCRICSGCYVSPHRLGSLGKLFKNVKDRVVLFSNTMSSVCEGVIFCVYDRKKKKRSKNGKLVNLAS